MNRTTLRLRAICICTALCLGAGAVPAFGQPARPGVVIPSGESHGGNRIRPSHPGQFQHRPGPGPGFGHHPRHRPMVHHGPHGMHRPMPPGFRPYHRFHRGDRLPPQYRDSRHVVYNWRQRHFAAPPRGYQYVELGQGNVALAAIATGVIASIIMSH